MFLLSPLILSLGIIAVVFVGILFVLDMRRSSHQNHLRKLMRTFVTMNAMQSFTVITEASNGAEFITPLLANLERQGYPKLQVIVFVDASAGSNALNDLRRMQRQKRSNLRLRIIRWKPGHDERALIKRYTDGEALVWLKESDRVSKNFFTRISIEFLDKSRHAFSPRVALKVDDTIGSASRALQLIARQTIATVINRNASERLIIRRTSYLSNEAFQPLCIEHTTVTVNEISNNKHSVYVEIILLLTILTVGVVSSIFIPYNWYLVMFAYVGIIALLMILRLFAYPYSPWSKLALALMTPLWPIVVIILEFGTAMRHLLDRLRGRRVRALRY